MKYVDGWWIPDLYAITQCTKHPVSSQMKGTRVIDKALPRVSNKTCVIQAGGRVGLWPRILSGHFDKVYSFEPEPRNFECAELNLSGYPNVELIKAALAGKSGPAFIEISSDNSGSHQVVDASGENCIEAITVMIDSYKLSPGLIMLDIEGYELYALEGAEETIRRSLPVIVVEQNSAMKRYGLWKGQVAEFLAQFGYVQVAAEYKDQIYAVRV